MEMDNEGTEIHLVARSHGPSAADTATFLLQTGSFEGYCDVETCVNEFHSIHLAVGDGKSGKGSSKGSKGSSNGDRELRSNRVK